MQTNHTPILFKTIAEEVATGNAEQYLTASSSGGVTAIFSSPKLDAAIEATSRAISSTSGTDIITYECQASDFVHGDVKFNDNFKGIIDINGVLVEVTVRKLRDGVHRVLFSRVDSGQMYRDHGQRLAKLEEQVQALQSLNYARKLSCLERVDDDAPLQGEVVARTAGESTNSLAKNFDEWASKPVTR